MYRSTVAAPEAPAVPPAAPVTPPWRLACEVADVLARMTFAERAGAYRARVFSPRELAIAAAWLPEEMPILNGELEWLAINAE